jgi:hypothetical protein
VLDGVPDGVPDHRDSVLTADERSAGDLMMICVYRALTARRFWISRKGPL